MGFFKKLFKGGIDTTLLPLEMVKDIVTLGGVSTDQNETYTKKRARKVKEAVEDAYDALDDDD